MRRMGRRGLCRCCPDAPAGKGMAGVWHGTPCAARNRKNAPPPGTAAGRQSVCEGAILCYAALRAAGKRGGVPALRYFRKMSRAWLVTPSRSARSQVAKW